jgi:predicted nuclease of predicted toxin-antitoxin system
MKFLVDAQLPRRVAAWFSAAGFEAIHMLDLPNGNRTSDAELNALSIREQYLLVTKDADFVNSFHLTHQPHQTIACFHWQYQQRRPASAFRSKY